MKKKLVSWVLSALMLLGVFAGCGTDNPSSDPDSKVPASESAQEESPEASQTAADADPLGAYEETVVLTIGRPVNPMQKYPTGESPEDNRYIDLIREKLNIDVQVIWTAASGTDYNQKVNLAIASDDLPDAMEVESASFRNAIKADQLEPLTDAINNYSSPVTKSYFEAAGGLAEEFVTFDGEMMALPNISVQASGVHTMWIRQDWLEKLGLDVPKSVDDLKTVAKAFVENDPDGNGEKDTIGIAGPSIGGKLYANFLASGNNNYGFDPVFGAFQSYPGYWVPDENGDPVYGSILPETKEALQALRDMYAEDLIDKEISIREDTQELLKSGKAGIFFGCWHAPYSWSDVVQADPTVDWQAYAAPLDADGNFNAHMNAVSSYFEVVRKGYEHPEAIVKIANLLAQEEANFNVGELPRSDYPLAFSAIRAMRNECEFTVEAMRDILSGEKTEEDFTEEEYAAAKLLKSDLENIRKIKLEPYADTGIKTWDVAKDPAAWNRTYALYVGCKDLVDVDYNEVYSMTYSQTPLMETRWANLKKLEDETFLKIIMGVDELDAFDAFVEEWKNIGGDEITQEVADLLK